MTKPESPTDDRRLAIAEAVLDAMRKLPGVVEKVVEGRGKQGEEGQGG
jgi:hypothetical protein